jgi:hypothetical protein
MTNDEQCASSNSTDATIGQSLRTRVETRKAELEAAITNDALDTRTRLDLELALSEVQGLLTGDLDHIPKVVAAELSTWLEAAKHLDEHHGAAAQTDTAESFAESG